MRRFKSPRYIKCPDREALALPVSLRERRFAAEVAAEATVVVRPDPALDQREGRNRDAKSIRTEEMIVATMTVENEAQAARLRPVSS